VAALLPGRCHTASPTGLPRTGKTARARTATYGRSREHALNVAASAPSGARSRPYQSGRRRVRPARRVARSARTVRSGKSALLNRLAGADAEVAYVLVATLDPLVRQIRTPDGLTYTLTDRVGFMHRLPHQLVDAFRSTLEEVVQADLPLRQSTPPRARRPSTSPPFAGYCATWVRMACRNC